jgi:hypothetical protein
MRLLDRLRWNCIPAEFRGRIEYTFRLDQDLFVGPPDSTKRLFIRYAQAVLGFPTFVETGTFMGNTALDASKYFRTIYTIELSPHLARAVATALRRQGNVRAYEGNSATVLPRILQSVDTSCLFWLDAHYSGGSTAGAGTDTPILEELDAIAAHPVRPHAVLIDDARVFGADDAYPPLEEVVRALRRIDANFRIGVAQDIIWAAPVKILDFKWRVLPSGIVVVPSATAPGDPGAPPCGSTKITRTRDGASLALCPDRRVTSGGSDSR